MASLDINSTPKETIEEKRKRCLLGDLPDDFLRIPVYNQHMPIQYPVYQPQYVKTTQLEITVIQARLVKNYGITRMDPYCKVRIGHKTYETVTSFNGSKNPYWNKKFLCPIPKGVESIHIAIFDEKTVSADEEIAYSIIPIPKEIKDGRIIDNWYPLSGKQGEHQEGQINIVMSMKEVQVLQNPIPYQVNPIPGYRGPVQHITQVQQPHVQPQQQPVPIEIKDSDVDQLKEMFPNIEKDVIRSILEEQCGNKDTCISALLSIADDTNAEQEQQQAHQQQQQS